MGNCLKTQLKEVVNNDNLLKLGQVTFIIVTNENATAYTTRFSSSVDSSKITVYKDDVLLETVPDALDNNSTYKFLVETKYEKFYQLGVQGISGVNEMVTNIDDFKYGGNNFSGMYYASPVGNFPGITGHVENALRVSRHLSFLYNTNVEGTTAQLAADEDIALADEFSGNMKITGNISDLSGMTGINYCNLSLTTIVYRTGLKAFLDGLQVNGKRDTMTLILGDDYTNDAGITAKNSTITFTNEGWTWA